MKIDPLTTTLCDAAATETMRMLTGSDDLIPCQWIRLTLDDGITFLGEQIERLSRDATTVSIGTASKDYKFKIDADFILRLVDGYPKEVSP